MGRFCCVRRVYTTGSALCFCLDLKFVLEFQPLVDLQHGTVPYLSYLQLMPIPLIRPINPLYMSHIVPIRCEYLHKQCCTIGITFFHNQFHEVFYMRQSASQVIRRPKLNMTSYSLNSLHLRKPWVIAWWSLAFPGFGHIACGNMAKGVFLFIGEALINEMANINLAIVYSFTGEFARAKEILDTQWLLLYCGILAFSIWDSYRLAIECNKLSVLADREHAPINPTYIGPASINVLDKRNPWIPMVWSLLAPGIGQLHTVGTTKAVFLMVVSFSVIVASNALPALGYTAVGDFQQAKAVINWQRFINIPSFYGFAAWDAYVTAVEINKLFVLEQARYFRDTFQNAAARKPLPRQGG